ncbi:MAG: co-chaperone GroES [Actinomycetia bacterium]|nr:co-chaperone GroES [Actinomycetes bacterium]
MKLKPVRDRIVVKPIEEEKTTKGGIVLPDNASPEKLSRAKVVEIGPGTYESGKLLPIEDIKKGDIVLYSSYAGGGREYKEDDETYYILNHVDIFAVIKK